MDLPLWLHHLATSFAKKEGRSRAELIRTALMEYLEAQLGADYTRARDWSKKETDSYVESDWMKSDEG